MINNHICLLVYLSIHPFYLLCFCIPCNFYSENTYVWFFLFDINMLSNQYLMYCPFVVIYTIWSKVLLNDMQFISNLFLTKTCWYWKVGYGYGNGLNSHWSIVGLVRHCVVSFTDCNRNGKHDFSKVLLPEYSR